VVRSRRSDGFRSGRKAVLLFYREIHGDWRRVCHMPTMFTTLNDEGKVPGRNGIRGTAAFATRFALLPGNWPYNPGHDHAR
jgi:hypothetical protein